MLLQIWRVPTLDSAEDNSAAAAAVGAGPGPREQPEEGDGAGQHVMEVGSGGARLAGTPSNASELPTMVLGVCLNGGVVWDCKWRPGSGTHGR